MKIALIVGVLLVAIGSANAVKNILPSAGCNGGGPGPDAKQNLNPVVVGNPTLVKSVPNGRMYTVGISSGDQVPVIHLYGTPYQKGFAHGTLVKDRAAALINQIYKWIEDQVSEAINGTIGPIPYEIAVWLADVGMDVGLDAMSAFTQNFTGKYYGEQMKGMSDASGVPVDKIRRIHMMGEITKGRCSMFGAWGKAIQDKNSILTMRALDWVMDGPFKNWPEITVYHANGPNENSFLNLGWSGWIGSITGVNDQQLSIHEIGVSYPDDTFGKETFFGVPFVYVLRDILQFDKTRAAAVNRLKTANRTCHLILGVGDGKEKRFSGIQYGKDVCDAMDDTNLRPVADWHPKIENVVYFGMDWMCPGFDRVISKQLMKYHGNLTAELAIKDVMSPTQTGDLHVYVADLSNDQFYFAWAAPDGVSGPKNAYERPFVKLNTKSLWAVKAPTADEYTVE